MPSGMRHAPGAGTTARSAKAPSGTEAKMRSPAAKPSTPRPVARTTPASSAPGMNGKGGFTWYCPRTMRRSKKLQPAARTSTASVPGASSGSGASRTRRSAGSIQRSTTIARMRYSIADDAGPTQPARKERHMLEAAQLGNVATRLLFENERVKVWEMGLEPGESSDLHRHTLDYLLYILEGASIDADRPDGESLRFSVEPGQIFFVPRGGTERAVNRSGTRFRELLVELKDGGACAPDPLT